MFPPDSAAWSYKVMCPYTLCHRGPCVCILSRSVVSNFLKHFLRHCSLPGSSLCGILQAIMLEWVTTYPPGDLPDPGIKPTSLCLLHWQVGSWPLASPGKPAVVHTWCQNEDSTGKSSMKFSGVTCAWEYRCVLQLLDIHFLWKNPFPELSPCMSPVTDSSLETPTNFSLGFQSCLPPSSHMQLPGSPFYWMYPDRISPIIQSFNGSHCLSKSCKCLSMAYATFTAGFWLTSPSC